MLKECRSRTWKLYPLHGSLSMSQQRGVFARPPAGERKIVISTNIAESSITIDDVVFVIDSGKHKEKTYDADANLSCLLPTWCSRASAVQREGRARRVQPGKCWHLFPRVQFDDLSPYQLPEIVRTPLEQLCIEVRSMGLARSGQGGIQRFVQKALTAPRLKAVENAVEKLKRISALDYDENLTKLGTVLGALPMDPMIAKSLVFSVLFGCLEPMLTIAALLSGRNPFVLPLEKKELADRAKRKLAMGRISDHRALLEAYEGYQSALRRGGHAAGRQFCWQNFLNEKTVAMAYDLREQFRTILRDAGFSAQRDADKGMPTDDEWPVVKACLLAGLMPNVVRVTPKGRRAQLFTRENGKVDLHPGSVVQPTCPFNHRFLVYSEKQKTLGGIFIYDATEISPLPILLFGAGDVQLNGAFYVFDERGRRLVLNEAGSYDLAEKKPQEDTERVAKNGTPFFDSDSTVQMVAEILFSQEALLACRT